MLGPTSSKIEVFHLLLPEKVTHCLLLLKDAVEMFVWKKTDVEPNLQSFRGHIISQK